MLMFNNKYVKKKNWLNHKTKTSPKDSISRKKNYNYMQNTFVEWKIIIKK